MRPSCYMCSPLMQAFLAELALDNCQRQSILFIIQHMGFKVRETNSGASAAATTQEELSREAASPATPNLCPLAFAAVQDAAEWPGHTSTSLLVQAVLR